ncbi:hypothetical protein ACYOEI_25435 [Singulisphaera rosea]
MSKLDRSEPDCDKEWMRVIHDLSHRIAWFPVSKAAGLSWSATPGFEKIAMATRHPSA